MTRWNRRTVRGSFGVERPRHGAKGRTAALCAADQEADRSKLEAAGTEGGEVGQRGDEVVRLRVCMNDGKRFGETDFAGE